MDFDIARLIAVELFKFWIYFLVFLFAAWSIKRWITD